MSTNINTSPLQPFASGYTPLPYSLEAAKMDAATRLREFYDKRALPIQYMIFLLLALLCLVVGIIISIYYIASLALAFGKQSVLSSPLNIQSIDYVTINATSLFNRGPYSNLPFIILPSLSLLFIIGFGIMLYFYPLESGKTVPYDSIKLILVIIVATVAVLVFQLIVNIQIGKGMRLVARRLTTFNSYVCSRIYKDYAFLKIIESPKTNIIEVDNSIKSCLKMLTPTLPDESIVKAFYTLSMYYYYQQLGLREPSIFEAFDLFNPTSLLLGACKPADYLPRYGTYIEDIGETIIRPTLVIEGSGFSAQKLDELLLKTNDLINKTNNMANTVYPEDSYNVFITITVLTLLIQLLPIIILYYTYVQPVISILIDKALGRADKNV